MSFEKRHLVGIAIIFLASLVLIEWIQGDFKEPLSFDSTGLTRVVSDFGIVITITFLATQLYAHVLWRFDSLCKIPILKKLTICVCGLRSRLRISTDDIMY